MTQRCMGHHPKPWPTLKKLVMLESGPLGPSPVTLGPPGVSSRGDHVQGGGPRGRGEGPGLKPQPHLGGKAVLCRPDPPFTFFPRATPLQREQFLGGGGPGFPSSTGAGRPRYGAAERGLWASSHSEARGRRACQCRTAGACATQGRAWSRTCGWGRPGHGRGVRHTMSSAGRDGLVGGWSTPHPSPMGLWGFPCSPVPAPWLEGTRQPSRNSPGCP